jgi:precorrin-6Y C5,15-methyltransferase (decarboxylating)
VVYPVTVVGAGPGSEKYILPLAWGVVEEADLLVGGESALSIFEAAGKEKIRIRGDLQGVLDHVAEARETKRVVVLLSGDPGFFSLLPLLRKRFGVENLRVIPGISSLQLGCARLGLNWHDMAVASVHGRGLEQLQQVCSAGKVAVLTDEHCTPAVVCRYFLEHGSHFSLVWVLTNLGRPGEEITLTGLKEGAEIDDRGNSIVILLREDACEGISCASEEKAAVEEPAVEDAVEEPAVEGLAVEEEPFFEELVIKEVIEEAVVEELAIEEWRDVVTPGLANELFMRTRTPLSQEEVRALVLSKARLCRGMVVYDLGAGTGGWTVETARLIATGRVYAVERDPAAAELARMNLKRFGLTNAYVVTGEAPDACAEFPRPDCVLVGGSGGRLQDIVQSAASWLCPGGRIVLSAVTPDTFSAAWGLLQGDSWEQLDAVLLQVSRVVSRGEARIFQGENPVFILQAVRREGSDS